MFLCDKHKETLSRITEVEGSREFFNTLVGLWYGWEDSKKLSEFRLGQRSSADLIKLFLSHSGQESNYLEVTKLEDIYNNLEEEYAKG